MSARKPKTETTVEAPVAPVVDVVGWWPHDVFSPAWRATKIAATSDSSRPLLTRVQFRRYPQGVMLFATDSYMTCGAWLGHPGRRPNEYTRQPDSVFSFDDQFAVFPKWLKAHQVKIPGLGVRCVIEGRSVVFDRADENGNGRDPIHFPLDEFTLPYPDMAKPQFRPTRGDLGSIVLGSPMVNLAKIGSVYADVGTRGAGLGIAFEFSAGPSKPQRWHVDNAPHVRGLVMPVRPRLDAVKPPAKAAKR